MFRFFGGSSPDDLGECLKGTLVTLRPPILQDWRAWAELRAESRDFVSPWEPAWPSDALSRTAFSRRIQRQANERSEDLGYSFLTFDRECAVLVGGLGLGRIRRGAAQSASLGYWVGQPYARCGYTSDAVRVVLDFAFKQLKLHRVEASCMPTNQASRGLLMKLGFVAEGLARGYLCINGLWQDHILFAILRDDWRG